MYEIIYKNKRRQWGQFIDHDITLMSEDKNTQDLSLDIDIYVPCCDVTFDPNCACAANITIEMFRTKAFNDSGTSPTKPRIMLNDITAYLDGSAVYGSDTARANELRCVSIYIFIYIYVHIYLHFSY